MNPSEPNASTAQAPEQRVSGSDTPRGLRLNNPGNIRHGKDAWQGMASDQPDESFIKFDKPVYGIRAITRILLNYERKGFDTIAKVIRRWAPPVENDTASYVRHVASVVGVKPNDVIDLDQCEIMLPLVRAIIQHENGQQPYSDRELMAGLRLAGVSNVEPEPLTKKLTGKAVTGAAVGLGLVSQVAEPAKQAANSLADLTGAPIIANITTILMTIAGIAVLAGIAKTYLDHRSGL